MTDDPTTPRRDTPSNSPLDDAVVAAVSAAVDGVATPDEARLLASEPAAPELAARFRSIATAVRAVDDVSAATRDRHVLAALREFDAGRTPAVVPRHQVQWMPRLLGAAAAVLALGVLGVAVANLRGSTSNDDLATDATLEAEEAGAAAFTAADDADASTREAPTAGGEDSSLADTGIAASEPDAAGGDTAPSEMTLLGDAGPLVIGLDELAELGRSTPVVESAEATTTMAPVEDAGCPLIGTVIGAAIYAADEAEAALGGTAVLITLADDVVRAIDPTDCSVVAEVVTAGTD